MIPNDFTRKGPAEPSVGDRNVERLVREAYRPEEPDAAFAERRHQRLCDAARDQAQAHGGAAPAPNRLRLYRRIGWAVAAAAAVAGVALVLYSYYPWSKPTQVVVTPDDEQDLAA